MTNFNDLELRRALVKPTKPRLTHFPGRPEIPIGVRSLNDLELDDCRVEAQYALRKRAKAQGWDVLEMSALDPTLMERMVEREILMRAILDADTLRAEKPSAFFTSQDDLASLGSVVVTDLMELYGETMDWANPHLKMTEEEVGEFVKQLGKGQSAELSLTAIEPITLRRCVISLAKLLSDLTTSKSITS